MEAKRRYHLYFTLGQLKRIILGAAKNANRKLDVNTAELLDLHRDNLVKFLHDLAFEPDERRRFAIVAALEATMAIAGLAGEKERSFQILPTRARAGKAKKTKDRNDPLDVAIKAAAAKEGKPLKAGIKYADLIRPEVFKGLKLEIEKPDEKAKWPTKRNIKDRVSEIK